RSGLSSEEVTDRKLEYAAFLVREGLEGEAPLEPERSQGGEPAYAESPRGAHVEEARKREAGVGHVVGRSRGGVAVELLEVPGVPEVREHDAANTDLVDDRELELEVLVVHEVAPDVGAVGDRGSVYVQALRERQTRTDASQLEAANVENAAEEE